MTASRITYDLIWLRPEPHARRPRLSRGQLTAAALQIADADGFEAVTMKRIAADLGVGTMTLYYYVRTKADVVALMQDAILAGLLVPDEDLRSGWRAAVAVIARRTRDVLLTHPWSLSSLSDAQSGPNAMRHIEQSLAALDDLELDQAVKLSWWGIVDDYVTGSALHAVESLARAARARGNPALVAEAITFGEQQLATGQFPRLTALYQQQSAPAPAAPDDPGRTSPPMTAGSLTAQFELGLTALLDGLTGIRPAPA